MKAIIPKIKSSAFSISIIYFVLGVLWIYLSDDVLHRITFGNRELENTIEIYKGIFFIISTTLLIFLLIRKWEKKRGLLENELYVSKEKWLNVFESANEPIFILDKSYFILEANAKASEVYGYSADEFKKMNINTIKTDDNSDTVRFHMNSILGNSGAIHELNHIKKNGSIFPVEVSTRAVTRDGELEFIHIVHDLTDRKKIENKLIESERKYRTLVETSHDLIWIVDKNLRFTFINEASREVYGIHAGALIGRNIQEFETTGQTMSLQKIIESSLEAKQVNFTFEHRIKDDNGKIKFLISNGVIVKNHKGEFSGLAGTSLDITDRVQSENRIKYLNRIHSLLTNINQLIVRASDRDKLLKQACRLAVEYGMFKMAWIGIPNIVTNNLEIRYKYGSDENYLEKLSISVAESEKDRGPIVRAINENIYYVSNDIENDPMLEKWKAESLKYGFRSFATFPIEIKNKVVGVYNVYSERKNFFGKQETELLLELVEDISFALEYIELEEERQLIENRYKNIVEGTPVPIFVQLEGYVIYINPAAVKILGGNSQSDYEGKSIFDIIHSDYHKILKNRLAQLYNGIPASETEEKFVRSDGSIVDVMVSAIPYKQDNKYGAQVFFRDLTEQKKAKLELEKINERLSLITKATNDAIWEWNLETDEMWWSEGFSELFGYTADEVEKGSESWFKRIHIQDVNYVEEGIKNVIEEGKEFWFDEYRFRKRDGTYAFVFDRGYIIKDAKSKPVRMIGSMIDITYRKKMEEDLVASEEKYRSIFENSPSVIIVVDKNFSINTINKPFAAFNESVLNKNLTDLFSPESRTIIEEFLKFSFTSARPSSFTAKSNDSKSFVYYEVMVSPQIKDGAVENLTLICSDISERVSYEKTIKDTNEKLHALAAHLQTIREEERTLIAREIHDQLGQELTALKMDISFLSKKIEKSRVNPDWDGIQDGLKSMNNIIDQTIGSVRRIASELRPDILDKLGLKEAIEWHAEEFEKRSGIKCRVNTNSEELNFSSVLNTTIYRIVQESLTNVARHSKATKAEINIHVSDELIYLRICDDGKGIKQSEIENSKSLGLVGIKERAYNVDGTFEISGEPGKGTVININIPIK